MLVVAIQKTILLPSALANSAVALRDRARIGLEKIVLEVVKNKLAEEQQQMARQSRRHLSGEEQTR